MDPNFDLLKPDVDISPDDEMFVESDPDHYFSVGRSAMECISLALVAASMRRDDISDILDLPCGHGRVLRWLRVGFPHARITACDLNRKGVDYCGSQFGATSVYSSRNPHQIAIPNAAFDLVWCGSLLTHLDAGFWPHFLAMFVSKLRVGGLLIFTTHGRTTIEWIQTERYLYGLAKAEAFSLISSHEKTGFGYRPYEGSVDYGVSVSSPAWVMRQLESLKSVRLVNVRESAWDKHQDVYACVRK